MSSPPRPCRFAPLPCRPQGARQNLRCANATKLFTPAAASKMMLPPSPPLPPGNVTLAPKADTSVAPASRFKFNLYSIHKHGVGSQDGLSGFSASKAVVPPQAPMGICPLYPPRSAPPLPLLALVRLHPGGYPASIVDEPPTKPNLKLALLRNRQKWQFQTGSFRASGP